MKFFFIVQGEGMGHSTQSLALRSILMQNGHTVSQTYLGSHFSRPKNQLYGSLPHEYFYSPVFLKTKDRKGIDIYLTFLFNLLLAPLYIFTIVKLAWAIRKSGADAVVVFYDMIGQLASFLSFSGKPVYTVSHHYFLEHPSFSFPHDRKSERFMLKAHSRIASLGAKKKLALSFTRETDIVQKKLYVIPPLLRKEILEVTPVKGDHIHIYCLLPGFLDTISEMAGQIPGREFRVFMREVEFREGLPGNVRIFPVSGDEFLESIRTCGTVICTAGFETLAEAVYLDKHLMVVPSGSHYEQYCNALDAKRAGVAETLDSFIFSELPIFHQNPAHDRFMKWIRDSGEIILKHLTE